MTGMLTASLVAEALAAVAGVALATRRPIHRPAATALVLLVFCNAVRVPVWSALEPYSVAPWEGWHRILVYLDGALMLAAAAIIPGLALHAFFERKKVAVVTVAIIWALVSIALAVAYPSPLVRGSSLGRIYLAADLLGLFVSCAAGLWWARHIKIPNSSQGIAIALIAADLATLLTPYSAWRLGFPSPVETIQVIMILFFAALAVVQGVQWKFSTEPSGPRSRS